MDTAIKKEKLTGEENFRYCSLIANGEKTFENGCPIFAEAGVKFCNCNSRTEGYICEYDIMKK